MEEGGRALEDRLSRNSPSRNAVQKGRKSGGYLFSRSRRRRATPPPKKAASRVALCFRGLVVDVDDEQRRPKKKGRKSGGSLFFEVSSSTSTTSNAVQKRPQVGWLFVFEVSWTNCLGTVRRATPSKKAASRVALCFRGHGADLGRLVSQLNRCSHFHPLRSQPGLVEGLLALRPR